LFTGTRRSMNDSSYLSVKSLQKDQHSVYNPFLAQGLSP
jgi:hypothetical protein